MSKAEIEGCYEANNEALRISGQGITQDLILSIKDTRGQAQISNFSFPQNKITSIKEISKKFVNVKVLNLGKNSLI